MYGYGNPGRRDDALGVLLAERIEAAEKRKDIAVETNYQLNVEDSLLLSRFDVVYFADACTDIESGASLEPVLPEKTISFSTHEMSPGSVLALCEELYVKCPETYILKIRGYEWNLEEGITQEAQENLEKAVSLLTNAIQIEIGAG